MNAGASGMSALCAQHDLALMMRKFFEMFLRARLALKFSHGQDPSASEAAFSLCPGEPAQGRIAAGIVVASTHCTAQVPRRRGISTIANGLSAACEWHATRCPRFACANTSAALPSAD
jgi:hypothetical protein